MSGVPKVKYRDPPTNVIVEPYGAVATIILKNRLRLKPASIVCMHTFTSSCERGQPPGGVERVAVWVRVVWLDESENLGFVCRPDAELIWAAWPKVTHWLTRCVAGPSASRRNR